MKPFSFGKTFPPSRSRTSDLWMSELCVYSPPLYQLSYRRRFLSVEQFQQHFYFKTVMKYRHIAQNVHSICFKLITLQLIIAGCSLVITLSDD
ncbi:hypothetical protein T07_8993 [Trichinella nelsoni]|uniref:Uncharacterized protein n=1 Tax=Trichinella nelsoni TaxID=6336 RepID=A0A0V0S7P4_9BILA|nr:hypothetical protein T07_8993 [Trichinella nelsoni]